MFKHEKQLFHPVAVERPNPQYAVLMQEQLGGRKRRTESGDAVYVAEFPHQRSGDQGFISRYRSRGIRPYGNGGANDQSAQRSRCGRIRRRSGRNSVSCHSRPESGPDQFIRLFLDRGLCDGNRRSVCRPSVQYRFRAEGEGGVRISLPPD